MGFLEGPDRSLCQVQRAVTNKSANMSEQIERAYQKQPPIFQNKKRVVGKVQKQKAKEQRFTKSVGLGFKTPREAIEGTYIDKKCPFTGNVSIRGRILTGLIHSMKMKRTLVIRRDYLHFIKIPAIRETTQDIV